MAAASSTCEYSTKLVLFVGFALVMVFEELARGAQEYRLGLLIAEGCSKVEFELTLATFL